MRLPIAAPPALAVALLLAAAAAAPAAAQSRYVAPTSESIISTTEPGYGDSPAQLIYGENRSTVPVTVFSVTLTQC